MKTIHCSPPQVPSSLYTPPASSSIVAVDPVVIDPLDVLINRQTQAVVIDPLDILINRQMQGELVPPSFSFHHPKKHTNVCACVCASIVVGIVLLAGIFFIGFAVGKSD